MSATAAARARSGEDRSAGRTEATRGGRRRPTRREALVAFLHLAALWGFAVAQPLFDLLGRNAEFFATRGSEGLEIVGFGLALAIGPPALLLALELLAGAVYPRLRRPIHLVFVGALAAVLAVQVIKRIGDLGATAPLIVAGLGGAAAAIAYARSRGLRTFLTALAPAPLVFLVLFLAASPVARLVFASEASARAGGVTADAPVVFIVFDELPLTSLLDARGEIDARRYPNFASLARSSSWFPNATGVHDRTSKAVPAVLTGRRPRPGSLPIAADHPRSLFTLLGGSYRMNVFEEATSVCPDDLCRQGSREGGLGRRTRSLASDLAVVFGHVALPQELGAKLPSVSEGWEGFAGDDAGGEGTAREDGSEARAGERPRSGGDGVDDLARGLTRGLRGGRAGRFDRFVGSLDSGSAGRALFFEHAFFPHAPFEHLPSGARYLRDHRDAIEGLVPPSGAEPLRDPFAAAQAYARHLLQAGYTDRLLGRVLERLRKRGLFDRSLIVVTADHGAIFRAGEDRRAVTERTFADIASVPLLVKEPGQDEPRRLDAYVQTTDIVPTIAEVLGVHLPWRLDGRSAFDPGAGRRGTVTMVQGAERRARISRGAGDRPVSVTTDALERGQRASLERKLALFGERADPFSLGPRPQLRGRKLPELPIARGPAYARADLDAPGELRAVEPDSGFVPAQLTGRVRSPAPRKRALAFAVNGRIAAVGESFFLEDAGVERLSALVPASASRRGPNEVEVLEIEGFGPKLRLRSLGRFGARGGA
ncbi:MAG TPA: sulfatase-like hydrolase/transferase [Thermoleophilaceae bacterium]|nr:sulfatase-like hydrolase/transferase [Thermoleophilaceae bacterium]